MLNAQRKKTISINIKGIPCTWSGLIGGGSFFPFTIRTNIYKFILLLCIYSMLTELNGTGKEKFIVHAVRIENINANAYECDYFQFKYLFVKQILQV